MDNKIPIYVLDEDAKKFLLFQQYYDIFCTMIDNGVFATKNGSVSLHFDNNGTLQTIQRQDFLYSRKFDRK